MQQGEHEDGRSEYTAGETARGRTVKRKICEGNGVATDVMPPRSRNNLARDEKRALRRLAQRGRGGATAREIGDTEEEGLSVGARLVEFKLVTVTRTNRFVLVKYVGKSVSGPISWDE
jgi:hypothetical protein